jgi:hypothetical protein
MSVEINEKPNRIKMSLLFLDFDGVLHPELASYEQLFCHVPRLEAVLRDFPEVEVVISSSWREHSTLDELRARFSPDIAARMVGMTPVLARETRSGPRREREILAWLQSSGRTDEKWLALDDTEWLFERYRDRLIACSRFRGLDAEMERELRAALNTKLPTSISSSKNMDSCASKK